MESDFIRHIERQLQKPLPGRDAQFKMAHVDRSVYEGPPPENAMQAAVLALFFLKHNSWRIALIERESGNVRDRHRGQISFPGGRRDETDTGLHATALREAEEEIGVLASKIKLLGTLTPLYIPVSNFHVHPFVGILEDYSPPPFTPQAGEVKNVLEPAFELFTNPSNRQITNIQVGENLLLPKVPCFNIEGRIVWGATAMMLSELLEALR
jgi:8-oxo-dGTP pyrophosphatase MutT (NUDIX family)